MSEGKPNKFNFDEAYKAFKAPFPEEAYSQDKSRGFALTSLKAQYIVERLNETVGTDGWAHGGDYVEVEGGIIFKGQLVINNGPTGAGRECVGFSANKKNIGDAYKSAKTDSLSKCASQYGIGNEMYKGKIAPPGATGGSKSNVSEIF